MKFLGYNSCKLCVLPDYNLKDILQINMKMKQTGLLDVVDFRLRNVRGSDGQRILFPFWNPKYDYSQQPINET